MTHSLVEISREDWIELRDLYNERRTEVSAHGLLQIMIQWIEKEPTLDVKIYSLDDDWKKGGTFILISKGLAFPHIFYNTLDKRLDRITTALNCLDTKLTYLFYAFSDRLKFALKNHLTYAGFAMEDFDPEHDAWYHIQKKQALLFKVDAPKDYKLSTLEDNHAEQLNSIWEHRGPGSIEFVKRLIRLNDNVGVFDKAGDLIAWCLRLPTGSLGMLRVVETHKRQVFGNLVVRYMSKIIASKDEEVFAPVVITNIASRAMFEKLGFTLIDTVYWMKKT